MTTLVNKDTKDTYRHKDTEVWKILGGGGQMPPVLPPLGQTNLSLIVNSGSLLLSQTSEEENTVFKWSMKMFSFSIEISHLKMCIPCIIYNLIVFCIPYFLLYCHFTKK